MKRRHDELDSVVESQQGPFPCCSADCGSIYSRVVRISKMVADGVVQRRQMRPVNQGMCILRIYMTKGMVVINERDLG